MNWIRTRIASSPQPALIAGKAVFLAGGLLILAAMYARVELIGINEERARASQPAVQKLAEIQPQFPTWWVPEGPVGYTVAAVLVLAGMYLTVVASEALKKAGGKRAG